MVDNIIPMSMGEAIAKAAGGPAKFAILAGGGPNDHYHFGSCDGIVAWNNRRIDEPRSIGFERGAG